MYKKSMAVTLLALTLLISGCDKKSDSDSGSNSGSDPKPPQKEIVLKKQPTLVVMMQYNAPAFIATEGDLKAGFFGDAEGSVNDYFKEVSGGQFSLEAVKDAGNVQGGVVKVMLSEDHPNSGKTLPNDSTDYYYLSEPGIKKSIEEIAKDGFDFSEYDTNKDKKITTDELTLIFVVAGAENGTKFAPEPGVGALTAYMNAANVPTVNGVTLMQKDGGKYFIMGERHYSVDANNSTNATIGVIVHELGHAVFDLPDLYNTTDNTKRGIGIYGLMGFGEWTGLSGEIPGERPTHMSAWSKIKAGWVIPEVYKPEDSKEITLYATGTANYNIVKIEVSKNEYFLIENRADTGYDKGLGSADFSYLSKGGIAIWHIDESVIAANPTHPNNNQSHKGVDLEEAQGPSLDDNNPNNDSPLKLLFYSGNKTEFTPVTTPNSHLYDGDKDSKVYITNISAVGSKMTLDIGQ